MHFDVRIGLVVFEQDVILGFILLDEGVFEGERVRLGRADDVIEIGDIRDHGCHFFGLFVVMEILPHAVFEHARLADVDDGAVPVEHDVYARGIGQ